MKGAVTFWSARPKANVFQRMVYFSNFVLLLFTLIAAASGCWEKDVDALDENFFDLRDINDDMLDLLLLNCRRELINAKKIVENTKLLSLEKFFGGNGISSERTSLQGKILLGVSNTVDVQVKRILLECVKEKNLKFLVSGEEKGSKLWLNGYLKSWFSGPDASKRRELGQSFIGAPGPSLTAASLSPSLAPSSVSAPSNSEVFYAHRPARPPSLPFFPPVMNNSAFPPAPQHLSAIPVSAPDVYLEKEKSSSKTVVIAVVVTAAVTFALVALLFLCYRRMCGNASAAGRNDENPLLNLSRTSSWQSASGHPNGKYGLDNRPVHSNSNHNKLPLDKSFRSEVGIVSSSKFEISLETLPNTIVTSSGGVAKVSHSPLKPPPGRSGTYEKHSVKPPPGGEDLSKITPNKGALCLPTSSAHVPPSSNKPSTPHPPPPGPPPPPPMPFGSKTTPRPPPPIPSSLKPVAHPPPPVTPLDSKPASRLPPPPSAGIPPPRPPPLGLKPAGPSSLGPGLPSTSSSIEENAPDPPKAKLKPFFWDKVLANPDHSMVWHQIKSGSFQFNEEMMETLFGYAPADKSKNDNKKESSLQDPSSQYIQIIDSKKSQNLSILLKALNVTTEEVCYALQEGDELPSEFVQSVLKMAPTAEEELKLRLYSGELSRLGPAERFLKVLVDIPFAFKRLESLFFMSSFQEDMLMVKESFTTLEAACTELRRSRLFLKLLEAVLKTGNRMNDGTFRGGAQAFKLDTLLKLSDVKGTDGKTTLLHFVVQEIIRAEGVRAARAAVDGQGKTDDLPEDSASDSEERYRSIGLQVVSGLGSELENVKKAAALDSDSLAGTVAKLGHALRKARDFLNTDMRSMDEENGFHKTLRSFAQNAEVDVTWLQEEDKRIMTLVKNTADYFHGHAGKDEGLRLFVIVRDFLIILDKACKEVKNTFKKPARMPKKDDSTAAPPSPSPTDPRRLLFPAIRDRRMESSSSDDDTP